MTVCIRHLVPLLINQLCFGGLVTALARYLQADTNYERWRFHINNIILQLILLDTITQTIRTVMTMFIHIKEKLFAYNSITIADGHKQGIILMEHIFLPRQPLLSGKIIRLLCIFIIMLTNNLA